MTKRDYMTHDLEEAVDIIADSIVCSVDSTFCARYLDYNITISVKNDLELIQFVAITDDHDFISTFRVSFKAFKKLMAEKTTFSIKIELVDYILDSMIVQNDYLYYGHRHSKPDEY